MLTFEYLGMPLSHQKIVPGNTATALSANCYYYQRWKLNFDAGTDAIVAGDWIVGATSGAVGCVVSITESSGTWAADNVVGYLIIDSMIGTFTNDEKLKVAADATMADVNGLAIPIAEDYDYKGMSAKAALVCVFANTALINTQGGKPDQTALIGMPMVANSSYILRDMNEIKTFKCIDYVAASVSIVQVTYYF